MDTVGRTVYNLAHDQQPLMLRPSQVGLEVCLRVESRGNERLRSNPAGMPPPPEGAEQLCGSSGVARATEGRERQGG